MVFGRVRNMAYKLARRGANQRVALVGKTNVSQRNVYKMANGTYKTANGTPVTYMNRKFTTNRRLNAAAARLKRQQNAANNYLKGINKGNLGAALRQANNNYLAEMRRRGLA